MIKSNERKVFLIIGGLVVVAILVFVIVSYVNNLLEIRTVQDTVEKFILYVQKSNAEELKKISGGSVFYSLFSTDSINYNALQEFKNKFLTGSKIEFFRVYRFREFSPEEKRKAGIFSWKVNVLVWNSEVQYAGGYIFYLSKFEDIIPDGSKVDRYKVIEISNVGEIYF